MSIIDQGDIPGHLRVLVPTGKHDRFWIHARAPVDHLEHARKSAESHITKALEFVPPERRRVAVQAGGHVGMWPLILGQCFQAVYTFEPDADNFRALVYNAPYWNIYPFRACLGKDPGWCDMRYTNKSGSNQVRSDVGMTPVMTLDQLNLEHLDLLALDVEGYETGVYIGGEETLARCNPVIICEETGKVAADGTGYSVASAHEWLKYRGYQRVAAISKDGIWAKT